MYRSICQTHYPEWKIGILSCFFVLVSFNLKLCILKPKLRKLNSTFFFNAFWPFSSNTSRHWCNEIPIKIMKHGVNMFTCAKALGKVNNVSHISNFSNPRKLIKSSIYKAARLSVKLLYEAIISIMSLL